MASIDKLPSGSWRVQVRRKGHKKISQTFSTEKLAREFARRMERDLETIKATGRSSEGLSLPLSFYFDSFIEKKSLDGKPLQRSALAVFKRLREGIGAEKISRISESILKDYPLTRRSSTRFRISSGFT